MSRLSAGILCVLSGFLSAGTANVHAGVPGGGGDCAPENGDANGDGKIDLGDPITILGHLFLGGPTELLPSCAPPGPSAKLPATGQTKCHDANGAEVPCDSATCAGQDGAYGLGCPMEGRFVDKGDGTVLDTCTGLQWQQTPGGQALLWCEALAYCEGLSFAGHDDWRLPNVRELQSLVDYGRTAPPLDPVFTVAGHISYWSSTGSDGSRAWHVVFAGGQGGGAVHAAPPSNRFSARAVRAGAAGGVAGAANCAPENGDVNGDGKIDLGDPITILGHLFLGDPTELPAFCAPAGTHELPATGQRKCYDAAGGEISCSSATCSGQDGAYALGCPTEGRFLDGGDGTVLDTCAGLVWEKTSGAQDVTWCEALAYSEGLSLAGHDDWRLPNLRELQSLIDYGRLTTALDPVFSLLPGAHPGHWSSTTLSSDGHFAWQIGFGSGAGGLVLPILKNNVSLTVRAVRTAP